MASFKQLEGIREDMSPNAGQLQLGLVTAIGRARANIDPNVIVSHSGEIAFLKKEIQEKEEEISKLRDAIQQLTEKNDDLKLTVDLKGKEIKSLKKKIDKLATEKKTLEKKLRSVEGELEEVKKEVGELKEANKSQEERIIMLQANEERLSKRIDGVKGENTTLKKELKDLKERFQRRPPPSVVSSERLALPHAIDLEEFPTIVLGELCRQIQIMMYKQVLPNLYDPRKSYKIKHIQEDIKDLKDEEQREAKRRYDDLKKKLKWQEKIHIRAMKSIQESRNAAAHPELTEEIIRFAVEHMEMNGKLTDWHSPDCVRAFVEMWKKLTQL